MAQQLDTDYLIVFGDEVSYVHRRYHFCVLTGQVLVGYPTGTGSKPSNKDGHLVLHRLIQQLFERGKPHPLNIIGNRILNHHHGIA